MQELGQILLNATKRLLRYVHGTTNFGIWYSPTKNAELVAYTDSDWATTENDMRSIPGYAFFLDCGVLSWLLHKQDTVTQSTAEVEYISSCAAANQAIWLRMILKDIGETQESAIRLCCGNESAINIANNMVQHWKTKHIKIKYHFPIEIQCEGKFNLIHCVIVDQITDIFTKALLNTKFEHLQNMLEMHEKSFNKEC